MSFASLPDETSEQAHLILPDNTPLESWGDAAPRPGVRSLVQPSMRPLFDTQAIGDTLLAAGRAFGAAAAAQLPDRAASAACSRRPGRTRDFRAALERGGVFEAAPRGSALPVAASAARIEFKEPQFEDGGPYLVLPVPTAFLYDGRGANLSWLQETPDPVMKVSWQSWAEVSHETAKALGVAHGDLLAVQTSFGKLELPVLPRGGLRDDVIAIPIGQGHRVGLFASHANDGRPGEARGVNVVALLPPLTDEAGGRAWLTARATVTATGDTRSRRTGAVHRQSARAPAGRGRDARVAHAGRGRRARRGARRARDPAALRPDQRLDARRAPTAGAWRSISTAAPAAAPASSRARSRTTCRRSARIWCCAAAS